MVSSMIVDRSREVLVYVSLYMSGPTGLKATKPFWVSSNITQIDNKSTSVEGKVLLLEDGRILPRSNVDKAPRGSLD